MLGMMGFGFRKRDHFTSCNNEVRGPRILSKRFMKQFPLADREWTRPTIQELLP